MIVVGVLDWQGGKLVRAQGGDRARYPALGLDPLRLAEAWRQRYGLHTLYFADLDAIAGKEPTWTTYEQLSRAGFHLWVDAGVREPIDRVRHGGAWRVVVGLETLRDWDALRPGDVFSLDLRAGHPLGVWGDDPVAIAQRAVNAAVSDILLLDLARVGNGTGSGTEALGATLARQFPRVRFYIGGGIPHRAEAERLATQGVRGVLVASALHAGTWDDPSTFLPAGKPSSGRPPTAE
jgi:phosphoribosylformimino-5-aminoimidazole carboxamide ribotide isomerase